VAGSHKHRTEPLDFIKSGTSLGRHFSYWRRDLLHVAHYINLALTTTKEVSDIVKSLKSKNSHGYDKISIEVLKLSLPYIISPLIYIHNKSLLKGIFPTRLKFSQIIPILKKGKKNQKYLITDQSLYFCVTERWQWRPLGGPGRSPGV